MSGLNTYPHKFKLEVVKIALFTDLCKSDLASKVGINTATLRMWTFQFAEEVKAKLGNDSIAVDIEAIQQLKKANLNLQVERNLLLKAAAMHLNTLNSSSTVNF